ncbi:uncharacterized protein [Venturia canescens]|uniref:uncharacterized protein n=1 Tax=Venturia canescens TaxID=32260 RepID=UPI001C9C0D56|nr:uncharacterized protein LOC122419079 [Venturia canescens]
MDFPRSGLFPSESKESEKKFKHIEILAAFLFYHLLYQAQSCRLSSSHVSLQGSMFAAVPAKSLHERDAELRLEMSLGRGPRQSPYAYNVYVNRQFPNSILLTLRCGHVVKT